MFRSATAVKLLAVGALMTGCAGEEAATQELVPAKLFDLHQVEGSQLTTVKQQIASLGYSTYLGFGGDEYGSAIVADTAGNTYVTGTTTTFGGGTLNVFVAKMSATGTNTYFTYFPGTQAKGIAVDASGNAYVASIGPAGPTVTKVNAAGTSMIYTASLGWNDVSGVRVDPAAMPM